MKKYSKSLSEKEIDELVIRDVNNLSKWEKPIHVTPPQATIVRLNNQLIERAKFFASIYKVEEYQDWLEQIIKERIQLEEKILNNYQN